MILTIFNLIIEVPSIQAKDLDVILERLVVSLGIT